MSTKLKCPYCERFILADQEVKICPECEKSHHLACWNELGECAMYGCGTPQTEEVQETQELKVKSEEKIEPTLSVRDAFSLGWQSFRNRAGFLIGVTLLMSFILAVFNRSGLNFARGNTNATTFVGLLSSGLSIWLGIGLLKIHLKIIDGKKVKVQDLFSGGDRFWSFFASTVLVSIMVGIGTIFLILPGIIMAVYAFFAPYLIVDRNLNSIEGLKLSFSIIKGHFWQVLGLILAGALLNLLGTLALGFGVLITVPITGLAFTFMYRHLLKSRS